jgi:hypothetical protein
MNVEGNIDLLKLRQATVMSIKGKNGLVKCVVVPVEINDIYVTADDTGKARSARLGLAISSRKEISQYGHTHYCKQRFSKNYNDAVSQEVIEENKKIYLGDFKEFEYNKQGLESVEAPVADVESYDDMPF